MATFATSSELQGAPSEHPTTSQQISSYRQRNLIPSHLYRLGTRAFGGTHPPRRRVIDSSLYVPSQRVPHAHYLRDGKPSGVQDTEKGPNPSKTRPGSVPPPGAGKGLRGRDFSEEEYKQWLAQRRGMRCSLDSMGVSEGWLCSKHCTPLETALLAQLRSQRAEAAAAMATPTTPSTKSVSESDLQRHTTQSAAEQRKNRRKLERDILKEIACLEKFLSQHRQRLVTLLLSADRRRDRSISVQDLFIILSKLKAPVSQQAATVLLSSIEASVDGRIDYRVLLSGGLGKLVEEYFERMKMDTEPTPAQTSPPSPPPPTTHSVIVNNQITDEPSVDQTVSDSVSLRRQYDTPSTMTGENGRLAGEYRKEGLYQFGKLVDHCKASGITLTWELAEKALLLPPDHTKKDCVAALRQPGLDLLSSHFADPPEEEDGKLEEVNIREQFGGAYKEIRGRRRAKFMRLSTGPARVKAKTDCWLTYAEFQKLTEHIRSRTGFKYQYHGLPDNSAFWPGALLHKLRLWMPSETLLDKPYSLYNIFQPVQHPNICNPFSPIVEQKTSWSENEGGYVQFGSQNRKKYCL